MSLKAVIVTLRIQVEADSQEAAETIVSDLEYNVLESDVVHQIEVCGTES